MIIGSSRYTRLKAFLLRKKREIERHILKVGDKVITLDPQAEDELEGVLFELKQLEKGTYGDCVNPDCRRPIDEKLLEQGYRRKLCPECDDEAELEGVRCQLRQGRSQNLALF